MSKPSASIITLVIVGTLVFLFNFKFTDSYMDTPEHLATELRSQADSAYTWQISRDVPFKYRLLFPKIVQATWAIVRHDANDNVSFVAVYRIWSYILFITAILTFYALLKTIGFSPQQILLGCLIFIVLPPMSFAFSVPVHTREDMLCYTILNLGLIAFLRGQTILMLAFAVTAVFCRETLLILPMVYFFYGKDKLVTRLLVSAIPGITWVAMRFVVGYEKYNAVGDGLGDNIENLFLTCAFLLMTFNVLWLPFFITLFGPRKETNPEFKLLIRTAPLAAGMILGTTLILGRVMEIRLLYLMAPWVIPIALHGFEQYRSEIRAYLRSLRFILLTVGCFVMLALGYWAVWKMRPDTYLMMKSYWWATLWICAYLCVASLPVLRVMVGASRSNSK